MIKVFIKIDKQLIAEADFRKMRACPIGSVVFLQTLVNEYNDKNNRNAEIVYYKNKRKLFL